MTNKHEEFSRKPQSASSSAELHFNIQDIIKKKKKKNHEFLTRSSTNVNTTSDVQQHITH